MALFVYFKLFIRMIFTFEDSGDRLSRMRRVRRIHSVTHDFLMVYPHATDSCGAYIAAHLTHLENLIERHTEAANQNDLRSMSFIEGSIDTLRYYIAEAMERMVHLDRLEEVQKIALPGKPA